MGVYLHLLAGLRAWLHPWLARDRLQSGRRPSLAQGRGLRRGVDRLLAPRRIEDLARRGDRAGGDAGGDIDRAARERAQRLDQAPLASLSDWPSASRSPIAPTTSPLANLPWLVKSLEAMPVRSTTCTLPCSRIER